MRTFVLGDVHGAFKALIQCINRAGFDYDQDRLIFLGDVADGWSGVFECIEELKKIRNLIMLKGNHDLWLIDWLESGKEPGIWLSQGGISTKKSYEGKERMIPDHLDFLLKSRPYCLLDKRTLFVHAGFTVDKPVEQTRDPEYDYFWDRELYNYSFHGPVLPGKYDAIYIGHTPTHHFSGKPVKNHNVWLMDQGAGWDGYLSMMNIENGALYQSDRVTELYPGEPGRLGIALDI